MRTSYRTSAARDPRGTATSAPGRRGATRYMLGVASTACCGLASRDARSSPPSNHHNHFVFFVSEDVFVSVDADAVPEAPPRRRSCNRPNPLKKHATLTNHNDSICTPVYASNANTFAINNAHAAVSAAATSPPVASRSLGTATAEPPQPGDCIAKAARDICSKWRVDGVLLLCESLLQHLLVSEPDAWRCCATVVRARECFATRYIYALVLDRVQRWHSAAPCSPSSAGIQRSVKDSRAAYSSVLHLAVADLRCES